MTDVLFLHGLESGPGGHKARWLSARYDAFTPAMPTREGLAPCLEVARAALREHRPRVLLGSSFGGAVTVALAQSEPLEIPLVLFAPATVLLGVRNELPEGLSATVWHAVGDAIVPFAHSEELASRCGPRVHLVPIPGDEHPLNALLADGTVERELLRLGLAARAP